MVNNNLGPRDVFLQLLSMFALYAAAVNFGVLLFQLINVFVPDALATSDFPFGSYHGRMRWALAWLVIVFPVFVWVTRYIARELETIPAKRELKVRKWLIYFTLFVAAIIIIGDLVSLVYNFLQGELTTRFILKVVAVLFISAAVFTYYIWQLKQERSALGDPRMRFFAWAIIAVVLAAVVAGFFVAGAPRSARLQQFDERRVSDLESIQWQILNYWQQKERLPVKLSELNDAFSGFTVPVDPATGAEYEYRILDPAQVGFELCATFDTRSDAGSSKFFPPKPYMMARPGPFMGQFTHDAGRVCFERTIDPERYKTLKPTSRD